MSKLDALAELVRLRRNDTYPAMISLHEFEDGRWDLDHVVPLVVPWTKSACNVDATLMIIGQDWASEKYFQRSKNRTSWQDTLRTHFGQDPQLPTNRNIRRLLHCFGIKWRQTYATDVSIFIKPGNMNGDIPDALLRYCAIKYTIPQLRIVRPKMVLCLGSRTFNAVRYALGMPAMKLNAACGLEPHTVDDQTGTEIYGVPHTGGLGFATCGGMSNILPMWQALANRLHGC
jgi:uracil-DNA glycosylase